MISLRELDRLSQELQRRYPVIIAVTGATGQLGQLVIADLKERISDSQIVAPARNPAKAASLGVAVR